MGSTADVPVAAIKCPSAPISYKAGELKFAFDVDADSDPNSFHFGQRWIQNRNGGPGTHFIRTAGQVIVKAAPEDASDPITVDLDVNLSHDELRDAIHIKKDAGGLVFESDTFLHSFTGMQPCISVVATISVAPSTNVSSFKIDTVVLPVELQKSLQLISNNVFIHSTSGSISSQTTGLNSRKVEIETTSSSISGHFPLADLLSVKSVSGTVTIDIEPKPAGPDPHDGTLIIRTTSGSINTYTLATSTPDRNFTAQVRSVSGTIAGSLLLGTTTTIDSASGSITADLATAGTLSSRVCIITSASGTIASTIRADDFDLGALRSIVRSRNGGVRLQYPAAWEGRLRAKTVSGSIRVGGEGVKIIEDGRPVPGFGKVVVAEKGDGDSVLSAETVSGAVDVRIG
jgi:hypothetical protein